MDNFYLALETFFQNLLYPCLDNWQINNQSFKKTALIWIATCRKTSLYARNSIIYVGLMLAKRKWNCCFSFWVNSTQSLTKKNNLHPTTYVYVCSRVSSRLISGLSHFFYYHKGLSTLKKYHGEGIGLDDFSIICRWQNFCPSPLSLVDRLYTVIHKTQKTIERKFCHLQRSVNCTLSNTHIFFVVDPTAQPEHENLNGLFQYKIVDYTYVVHSARTKNLSRYQLSIYRPSSRNIHPPTGPNFTTKPPIGGLILP